MLKGLYTRDGIYWARFKVRGIGYRQSLRTRTEATAEKRLKAMRESVQNQVYYGEKPPVSWADAVIAWDASIKRSGKRETTMGRYLVSLRQVREWLDGKDVQKIDANLVQQIVRERARNGASNATIRRDLTAIASVLDVAIDEGWIEENVAHSYDRRRLKEQRNPIVLPDVASMSRLFALKTRFTDMAEFAVQSGMREEEIASLTHSQIDRARMAVSLTNTKGRRAREVPLTKAALAILDRQPQYLRSPYVFWRGAGERFKEVHSRFYAVSRAAAQKAAQAKEPFRRFRFHDLRHLFAVNFLRERRGGIYDLQQILGHSSVKTTELYLAYLTPEEKQAAISGVAQEAAQHQRFAADNGGQNG